MIYFGFSLAVSLLNNRHLGMNLDPMASLNVESRVVRNFQKTQGGSRPTAEVHRPLFHNIGFVNSY